MEIDVENSRRVNLLTDDMTFPNLLKESARSWHPLREILIKLEISRLFSKRADYSASHFGLLQSFQFDQALEPSPTRKQK
jgi:hypothetical protein